MISSRLCFNHLYEIAVNNVVPYHVVKRELERLTGIAYNEPEDVLNTIKNSLEIQFGYAPKIDLIHFNIGQLENNSELGVHFAIVGIRTTINYPLLVMMLEKDYTAIEMSDGYVIE